VGIGQFGLSELPESRVLGKFGMLNLTRFPPRGLDAPLIMEEGGKTRNSSISLCDLADKSYGWKTLR
jgi:hypothetical protein